MLFDQGDGVAAPAVYPVTDGFDLLAFPAGDSGDQGKRLDQGLLGILGTGPLLVPIGQATVGHGEPFVQFDRFLKFQFRAVVLGQQPIDAFQQAFSSGHRACAESHSEAVLDSVRHQGLRRLGLGAVIPAPGISLVTVPA
jgi:hypothetical protein